MANFSDLTGAASAQDQVVAPTSGLVARLLGGNWNGWTIALSILLICMSYDQIMYQWRKGPLPGPMFKIPFIGPFLESVNPKFSDYEAKWASGPLSCVSVFHK